MVIIDGECTVTVEGVAQTLGPGDVCVINRGLEHSRVLRERRARSTRPWPRCRSTTSRTSSATSCSAPTAAAATSSAEAGESGRVALVTGASRGIGEAVAVRLARDGHHVALVQRGAAPRAVEAAEALGPAGDGAPDRPGGPRRRGGRGRRGRRRRTAASTRSSSTPAPIDRHDAIDFPLDVWQADARPQPHVAVPAGPGRGAPLPGAGLRAGASSSSPRCSPSRAASACQPTRRPRAPCASS